MIKGVIFDFDLTLYDSKQLEVDRDRGDWQKVYSKLGENSFYPGAIELIKTLKSKGIAVSIASNAPKNYISRALNYYNVAVDFIASYHDVKNHKPAPDVLNLVLNKFDYVNDEVVYVGDNDIDFETAKAAGITFYGVKWGVFNQYKYTIIDFSDFIEEVVYKHCIVNSKRTKSPVIEDGLISNEGNVFYLGYYKTRDTKNCYSSIKSKLLKFKDNDAKVNQQWTKVVKVNAPLLPKVDIVVRALGHKEVSAGPNRIDIICNIIAEALGATYSPGILSKKESKKSVGLSRREREEEISGKYTFNNIATTKNINSILIVDDVYTTGATTKEISRILSANFKNIIIYVFSLLRTIHNKDSIEHECHNHMLYEALEFSSDAYEPVEFKRSSHVNKFYSANYCFSNHNFVIQNIPNNYIRSNPGEDRLLSSIYILKNILQRGKPTLLSKYLQEEIGDIHKYEDFTKPIPLIDNSSLKWNRFIRGAEESYNNVANIFYNELIDKYFDEYCFIKNLLVPELKIYEITQVYDESLQNQQVDFYLPQAFLIIEIDGLHHNSQVDNDKYRDYHTRKYGIKTVRFTASEIRSEDKTFLGKVESIKAYLHDIEEQDLIRKDVNPQCITLGDYKDIFHGIVEYDDSLLISTAVMRFQLLILELLESQALNFDNKWVFQIKINDIGGFSEPAISDLYIWLTHLFYLLDVNITLPRYKIHIVEQNESFKNIPNSTKVDFSLFKRYTDEFQDNKDVVYIRTHYLDYFKCYEKGDALDLKDINYQDYDYFTISTLDRIDYPIRFDELELFKNNLLFFLENIFLQHLDKVEFREGQFEIVSNALLGNDTIGLLPTGSGKSVCYQLSAILQPCISFVVCPIKSLMYDQKYDLDEIYFSRVNFITGDQTPSEKAYVQKQFSSGKYFFIFVSPERFQSKAFRAHFKSINQDRSFSYAVIDEVHCLSEWGHDFRTSYLNLSTAINRLSPDAKYIGLTATASVNVLKDIQKEFSIEDLDIKTPSNYTREELSFNVVEDNGGKYKALLRELTSLNNDIHIFDTNTKIKKCGIIFTPFVNGNKGCYQLASDLSRDLDIDVKFFSGGKPKDYSGKVFEEYKKDVQLGFKNDEFLLLTATKAFGMGVNKGNIYYTYHYGLPGSMESLYQEAGRAGRNKELFIDAPARCTVILTSEKTSDLGRLWDPIINLDELNKEVKNIRYDGDLNGNFFLFLNSLRKISEEAKTIKAIYSRYYNPEALIQIIKAPDVKANKQHVERCIYRLSQIGIISDWTVEDFFRGVYEVEFIKHELSDVKSALINTVSKYDKEFVFENLRSDGSEMYQYVFQNIKDEMNIYFLVLLIWSYEHFAYNRRQSIKNVYENCIDLSNGKTTQKEFKTALENYFIFNKSTNSLQIIADDPDDHLTWFNILYKTYDNEPTEELGDVTRLLQIKGQLSRFLESYMNSTGLNIVSGMLRLLLNEYDDSDGKARMELAIKNIKLLPKDSQKEIYTSLAEFSTHLDEKNTNKLLNTVFSITKNKQFLHHVYTTTANEYSASLFLGEEIKRINKINKIVRGIEWQIN